MATEAGSIGLTSGTISSRQKGHETLKSQSHPPPALHFLQQHHDFIIPGLLQPVPPVENQVLKCQGL